MPEGPEGVAAKDRVREETKSMARKITLEELKKHKDSKSLWIAINDNVYDVTKFMEEVNLPVLRFVDLDDPPILRVVSQS